MKTLELELKKKVLIVDESDSQIKNMFTAFLEDLVDNPYNQFFENFEIWLDNLSEEEYQELLNK